MKESLVIHKEVLPEVFSLVYDCMELIEEKKISVSEACKEIGISRSTYYKYCDHIFPTPKNIGKRCVLLLQVDNEHGALSSVLNCIASHNGHIITINQDTPITRYCYITLMIDTLKVDISIDNLVKELLNLEKTKNVTVLATE